MTMLQVAQATKRAFRHHIRDLNAKSLNGNKKAAVDIMRALAARNWALRGLGYEMDSRGRLYQTGAQKRAHKIAAVYSSLNK